MFAFMEKRCHVQSYKQLAKVNISPPPQWRSKCLKGFSVAVWQSGENYR